MDARKGWVRYCAAWLILMSVADGQVQARSADLPDSMVTVQKLLNAELKVVSAKQTGNTKSRPQSTALIGIWGVQKTLTALVNHRGRLVEFRHAHARAMAPFQRQYSLIAIEPPCVRFMTNKKRVKVCL